MQNLRGEQASDLLTIGMVVKPQKVNFAEPKSENSVRPV
jgi:hypothetical protein